MTLSALVKLIRNDEMEVLVGLEAFVNFPLTENNGASVKRGSAFDFDGTSEAQ